MNQLTKRCKKCGQEKNPSEFYDVKLSRDGKASLCKPCYNEFVRKYKRNNPDKYRKLHTEWARTEKGKESCRRWRENNPDKVKMSKDKWEAHNSERRKKGCAEYYRKTKLTPSVNLNRRMRTAIYISLNGSKKGRKWEKLVGYTAAELSAHIEKHFLPGMNWENRSAWHIDHIIPLSAFNFKTPYDVDFKRCWSLKNLRPLWKNENLSKGGKLLSGPFQPSLLISLGEASDER